jgi:uridine kinase
MNIIEAYKKYNSQLIILISGYSGTKKSKLAKFIAKLFDLKSVSLNNFYYEKYENYVDVKEDVKILDYDDIYKSVDWKKLNDYVKENKFIIISGFGFPSELINFKTDFQIYLKINKQNLFQNREEFIKKHNSELQDDILKLIFNKITFAHNEKIMKESKIDKYVNLNESNFEDVKKDACEYMFHKISKWLNENKT